MDTEAKATLKQEIKTVKHMLDNLASELEEISENDKSLSYGPALMQIDRVQTNIILIVNSIKEFQSLAGATEEGEEET